MKHVPFVSLILENPEGEILLLLRDSKLTMAFPKHWTLIGGNVADGETPELAASRVLKEETGLKLPLSFWKRYDRDHPFFIIDQHVYTAKVESHRELLILGRDAQFFKACEIRHLKIGYGFDALLNEYFQIHER